MNFNAQKEKIVRAKIRLYKALALNRELHQDSRHSEATGNRLRLHA